MYKIDKSENVRFCTPKNSATLSGMIAYVHAYKAPNPEYDKIFNAAMDKVIEAIRCADFPLACELIAYEVSKYDNLIIYSTLARDLRSFAYYEAKGKMVIRENWF